MTLLELNVRLPDHVGRSSVHVFHHALHPGEIWRVPWQGQSLLYYIVGGRQPYPEYNVDVVRVDPRGGNRWSCVSAEYLLRGHRVREAQDG
jgi:hypothetical protein